MKRKDDTPEGGWLAPPGNTSGLPALMTARKGTKKKFKWVKNKLSKKDKKKRKKYFEAMARADKKKKWNFQW